MITLNCDSCKATLIESKNGTLELDVTRTGEIKAFQEKDLTRKLRLEPCEAFEASS